MRSIRCGWMRMDGVSSSIRWTSRAEVMDKTDRTTGQSEWIGECSVESVEGREPARG
jgi:hypothetical protein